MCSRIQFATGEKWLKVKIETAIALILAAIVAAAILYPIITSVPEEEEMSGAWKYENGTVADPRKYMDKEEERPIENSSIQLFVRSEVKT